MAAANSEFASHCCDLLSGAGRCDARRMFGGWGIRSDGLTVAILADLGQGETLWLKANDATRGAFEAAGCARFTYDTKNGPKSVNYFAAPADAMESPALMLPWARLAMQAALAAANAKPPKRDRQSRRINPAKTVKTTAIVAKKQVKPGRPNTAAVKTTRIRST